LSHANCPAALSPLVDKANTFILNCIATSTRATYKAAMNSYLDCFAAYGEEAPFPATQTSLCVWLTHSAIRTGPKTKPLQPSTMRTYLSGLCSLHEEMGYSHLLDDKPLVSRCFKGIKKTLGRGTSERVRRPITTDILRHVKAHLQPSFSSTLFFAAATLATYGLLRMGEFTTNERPDSAAAFKLLTLAQLSLKAEDGTVVSMSSPEQWHRVTNMSLVLRVSKTDPFRQTVTVHIGHPEPVQAMLQYLRMHPCLTTASSPLFVMSATCHLPLTREAMIQGTRTVLRHCGYNENQFSGHSYRKGGATSLFKAGVAESVIQLLGRWLSDAYKLYVVTPLNVLLQANRRM
jgi:hypothetical protein